MCGIGGSDNVRGNRLKEGGDCESADKIHENVDRLAIATEALNEISNSFDKKPLKVQACMRPCMDDGQPVIGNVCSGLTVIGGGNCWGITWAPVMGLAGAQLVLTGKSEFAHKSFDPLRFSNLKSQSGKNRGRHKGNQPVGEQW
jgi:glycine/D-amino acid oxidase-like deaminating enzyme